ncbi:hypothetical protein B1964_19275 [Gordonia sp. i37]|nr:hypothetical protein B1964_19275 [Gordonia sp. i37]
MGAWATASGFCNPTAGSPTGSPPGTGTATTGACTDDDGADDDGADDDGNSCGDGASGREGSSEAALLSVFEVILWILRGTRSVGHPHRARSAPLDTRL